MYTIKYTKIDIMKMPGKRRKSDRKPFKEVMAKISQI